MALLAVVTGLRYRQSNRAEEMKTLVDHTQIVRYELSNLLSSLEDLELGAFRYIVTDDRNFLEKFEGEITAVGDHQRKIGQILLDNDQKTRLANMEAIIEERIEMMRSNVAVRQISGAEAALREIADDREKVIMASIREQIVAMEVSQQALLDQRSEAAKRESNTTNIIADIGTGMSVLMLITVFALIQREKRMHQQTLDQMDRFFSLSLDMLCISNVDGYFKRISPAFTHTLGWSVEEILARPFTDFVHPDDLAATLQEVERQVVAGEMVLSFENRYKHKDGSWRVLSWKSVPQPGGMMYAVARDVTEQKQAVDAIQHLNSDLHQRTLQLEESNKELESFSYSVSHDLRAPLRHVQGYVEMLGRALEGSLTEKARHYINTIAEASIEMGQLIDDLLTFSRMGRAEMIERTVDLNNILQEVCRSSELEEPGRNIIWTVASLPLVIGDAALLRQVLINLVGNAVKYTRKRNPALIEIGCAGEEDGRIVFFIRDNGAGFDMQYVHKLFGVFQRLHRTEEFEGTGIGLAIVQRIIARHDGRIWAEGEVGVGATFFFTLKPATTTQSTNRTPINA